MGQINFLLVLITVIVAFKDTVNIFDYEIHLKYCQDTEGY